MGLNARVYHLLKALAGSGKALAAGYPAIMIEDLPSDAHEVFKGLGYELDVIDIYRHSGCERIFDLNTPCDLGQYDLVLDHGTLEHCFNIGQAAFNLASAVKLNGFIVQHLPMSMFNHGFYNLNPTWFNSFYPQNGFQILHLEAMAGDRFFQIPLKARFDLKDNNTLLTMVAKKTEEKQITFPIQERYRA